MKTKKNQKLLTAYAWYKQTTNRTIYDCYKKPSYYKQAAWNTCIYRCNVCDGKNLRVIHFNTHIFTAGFEFEQNGKKYFAYIAPSKYEILDLESPLMSL